MTLSQIVGLIKKQNPDWTPQAILDLINGFQDMVLKSDSDENIYFDTTTGDLPYLTTMAGVFLYTLSNIYYKIKEIVVRNCISISNNPIFSRGDLKENFQEISIEGKKYRVIDVVKNQPYGRSGIVTVMFRQDPGNSTTTYQIYGYTPVNAITTISSTLNIPEEFHLSIVVPAIQMLIDGLENGRYAENLAYINESLLPQIIFKKLRNSVKNNYSSPMDI